MSGKENLSQQDLTTSTFSVSSNDVYRNDYSGKSNGKAGKSATRAILCSLFVCLLAIIALAVTLAIVVTKKIDEKNETPRATPEPGSGSQTGDGSGNCPDTGNTGSSNEFCTTPDCVKAASNMMKSMDMTVDPCVDFFEYACGGWTRSHVIPEDKAVLGTFYTLRDDVDIKLKAVLEQPIAAGEWEAITKAKQYYQSCINLTAIEDMNLTEPMVTLNELGGWPVVSSSWSESSFNLEDVLLTTRKYTNSPPIFDSYAYTDSKNPDARILYVDQPGFGMPNREYYLKGRNDKTLLAYEQFATEMAVMFGANEATAKNDMKDMVDFEIKLANISLPSAERRDEDKLYNLRTIQNIASSSPAINWNKYFTNLLRINGLDITLGSGENIISRNPEYLSLLSGILTDTPKRTVANYIVWRYVARLPNALPERVRDIQTKYRKALVGTAQVAPRWKTCAGAANSNFGLAVGNLFIAKYFGAEAKVDVENMIKQLRVAMKELIQSNDWMDTTTKDVAKEKADYIKPRIGYPDEVDLESKVNKEYVRIHVTSDDFYKNTLSIWINGVTKNIKDLREPVDKNKWSTPPATVNAFYSPQTNQIMFPAGILQPPFYHRNYPDYLNFGGIGYVIGHEITHGFDDSGRRYDKHGKLNQWWTNTAINNFKSKAECIQNQYGNYTVAAANMNLNGKLTLGENIADNGGIRESFKAYRKLVATKHKGKEEKPLPGMEFSPNQLFFLNAAQVWCGIIRPKEAVRRIRVDPHSDARSRVVGPLQNFDEFSKTFNCQAGTYMNPTKKCVIWG
ncbi:endothelin-converting enzyme homolog isoform X1 [Mytilus galloprovincialis]|uniref:endothelin-converting enzyme homolog isoform X1 n=1 Tax=Mytilus galloprovincialis TaxID=29158 RepID=UPI003F7C5EF8